jgi:endonuclease-3
MNKKSVNAFFTALESAKPHPRTELFYTNPFTLLVAVMLSAQSTDKGVNKATKDLFKKVSHPKDIVRMGLAGLKSHIKTIGLYNGKAKNILRMSEILLEIHGGKVPKDRAALEALPGVGRKTANVVLNEAFGVPTIAVDTHVFRVSNRTGLAPGKTPREVEDKLLEVAPEKFRRHAHHWLILLGRYTCLARKPGCPECPVRIYCEYKEKTR